MDTTKQYILMAEKAEEIQKLRNKRINTGDFYYQRLGRGQDSEGKVSISKIGIQTHPVPNPIANRIWLPRQDQLQEMVRFKIVKLATDKSGRGTVKYERGSFSLLCDFMKWIANQEKEGCWQDKSKGQVWSMEQLWLAFVMKEKFGEIWVKEKWILERKITTEHRSGS